MFEALSLPFESKSPVGRAAAQEGCKPPGLNLNNGSDLVLLSEVPFLRNQPFEHSRADQFARLTIQEAVFHPDIHAQIDRAQDRAIHDRLPELFRPATPSMPIKVSRHSSTLCPSMFRTFFH